MKISKIVTEPLDIHNVGTKKERIERAKELMSQSGIKTRKKANNELSKIFYNGSEKIGKY